MKELPEKPVRNSKRKGTSSTRIYSCGKEGEVWVRRGSGKFLSRGRSKRDSFCSVP